MTEHPEPGPQFEPLPPADQARSRSVLLAVSAVVVLGLAVAGVLVATSSEDAPGADPAASAASSPSVGADAGCSAVISKPVPSTAVHLAPPTKVDYVDAPPAFGDHWPTAAPFGRPFYAADRPAVEELVHSLEHGYTIAWYDAAAAADEAAISSLQEIALGYQRAGERFIAAPWSTEDGAAFPDNAHIAVTRWSADPATPGDFAGQQGNWLYCGTVDPEAIKEFVEMWPNANSAEPGLY